jgi:hypothetical protein
MKKINLDIEDIVHFYNFIFLIFSHCTYKVLDSNTC